MGATCHLANAEVAVDAVCGGDLLNNGGGGGGAGGGGLEEAEGGAGDAEVVLLRQGRHGGRIKVRRERNLRGAGGWSREGGSR